NYQFELYGENSSLITDVRTRVKQEPLEITERKKRIDLMPGMDNGDIVNFLGSLDYVSEKKHKPSPTDIDGEQEPKSVETSTAKVTSWMGPKGRNSSTQVKVIQTSGAKAKKRIA
ncbi:unnamed protein product, partial [Rotaria socialis]